MSKYLVRVAPIVKFCLRRQDVKYSMDLKKAVSNAERLIGYPVTFKTINWIKPENLIKTTSVSSKEFSDESTKFMKIVIKNFMNNYSQQLQNTRLFILLISKAAGHSSEVVKYGDFEDGLLRSQHRLAEIAEMIKAAHFLHTRIINYSRDQLPADIEVKRNENKVLLITGDYLWAESQKIMAEMRNQHVFGLFGSCLRDYFESEFIGERDPQNIAIPSFPNASPRELPKTSDSKIKQLISCERKFEPLDTADCMGDPVREWTMRNVLNGGSLLGFGCQGALHLAGHAEDLQNSGYVFGCHVALAWQAATELLLFTSSRNNTFPLVSAPVLFALQEDNSIYKLIECSKSGVEHVDYNKLKVAVERGRALDLTLKLYQEHSKAATRILDIFPRSESVEALEEIISSLNDNEVIKGK